LSSAQQGLRQDGNLAGTSWWQKADCLETYQVKEKRSKAASLLFACPLNNLME